MTNLELDTPKHIQTQETRQRIYDAADNILKEKGFAYLTISNICKVANVSNGTFFYHFKTKDELLTHYNYAQFANFRETHSFGNAVDGQSFDRRIIIFYDYWIDYMVELGIEFFTDFYNTKNHALDVRRWNQQKPANIWDYPGECIKQAKLDGLLKDSISASHCASVFAMIMKGIAFDWCLSEGAFDMHAMLNEIMGPYLESIKK